MKHFAASQYIGIDSSSILQLLFGILAHPWHAHTQAGKKSVAHAMASYLGLYLLCLLQQVQVANVGGHRRTRQKMAEPSLLSL